jgi:hypothetical protein
MNFQLDMSFNLINFNAAVANLRLLQAADMYFGQFRSLDMTTVDLESELQIVPSPDKSSFDSPPVKAAHR